MFHIKVKQLVYLLPDMSSITLCDTQTLLKLRERSGFLLLQKQEKVKVEFHQFDQRREQ